MILVQFFITIISTGTLPQNFSIAKILPALMISADQSRMRWFLSGVHSASDTLVRITEA